MLLSLITPERTLIDREPITRITLPTTTGEITVLNNHEPLFTLLKPGEVVIEHDGKIRPLVISGGFLEIAGSSAIILADTAEHVHELDIKRAEEAKKSAEELLKSKHASDVLYSALAGRIEKELARIKVGRKYKHLKPPTP